MWRWRPSVLARCSLSMVDARFRQRVSANAAAGSVRRRVRFCAAGGGLAAVRRGDAFPGVVGNVAG